MILGWKKWCMEWNGLGMASNYAGVGLGFGEEMLNA